MLRTFPGKKVPTLTPPPTAPPLAKGRLGGVKILDWYIYFRKSPKSIHQCNKSSTSPNDSARRGARHHRLEKSKDGMAKEATGSRCIVDRSSANSGASQLCKIPGSPSSPTLLPKEKGARLLVPSPRGYRVHTSPNL